MKKILFAALAATAMLSSCSKNTEPVNTPEAGDGQQVQITIQSDETTRAFFDQTAAAEPWEKEITMLYVYVFDKGTGIITSICIFASMYSHKCSKKDQTLVFLFAMEKEKRA